MTVETAQHIERYVLAPSTLSAAERAEVEAAIDAHPAARAWAQELRAFYDALDLQQERPSAVRDLVNRLFPPPSALPLRALPLHSGTSPTTLAADAPSRAPRLETIGALTADGEGIVVRVLRDRAAQTGRLYVLARDADLWGRAMVAFPQADTFVPTDESGTGTFPLPPDATSDAFQQAYLHRLLAETTVPTSRLRPDVDAEEPVRDASTPLIRCSSNYAVRVRSAPDASDAARLRFAMQPADAARVEYVALLGRRAPGEASSADTGAADAPPSAGAAGSYVFPVSDGDVVLQKVPDTPSTTIRLHG